MTIVPEIPADMVLTKYGRFWAVSEAGVLVCVCVYKRGAAEVIRRLTQVQPRQGDHPCIPHRCLAQLIASPTCSRRSAGSPGPSTLTRS